MLSNHLNYKIVERWVCRAYTLPDPRGIQGAPGQEIFTKFRELCPRKRTSGGRRAYIVSKGQGFSVSKDVFIN